MTALSTATISRRFCTLRQTAVTFLFLCAVTGLIYPLAVTGIAQTLMPEKAAGSLVVSEDRIIGSALIGQNWEKTPFFQSRPSAVGWDAASSGATNYGPTNPKLLESVQERIRYWQTLREDRLPVPVDLLTSSASGLDPHISRQAALYQIPIVSRRTGLSEDTLRKLIDENDEAGLFGRHHFINVLRLNMRVQSLMNNVR